MTIDPEELVRRIWARDPSVWTGKDEAKWLGWLDAPARMRQLAPELEYFAEQAADDFSEIVLLGMGGSSLAPEVIRRTFGVASYTKIETTRKYKLADAAQAHRDLEGRQTTGSVILIP